MSFTALKEAMSAIQANPDLSMAAKLVLIRLADVHNQETGRCDPSLPSISRDLGISERAVRIGIRSLEAARLIKTSHRQERSGAGPRCLSNRYKLFPQRKYNLRDPAGNAGGTRQEMPGNQEVSAGASSATGVASSTPAYGDFRTSAFDDLVMLIEDFPGDEI
jgi:predicted transcriptional regulator